MHQGQRVQVLVRLVERPLVEHDRVPPLTRRDIDLDQRGLRSPCAVPEEVEPGLVTPTTSPPCRRCATAGPPARRRVDIHRRAGVEVEHPAPRRRRLGPVLELHPPLVALRRARPAGTFSTMCLSGASPLVDPHRQHAAGRRASGRCRRAAGAVPRAGVGTTMLLSDGRTPQAKPGSPSRVSRVSASPSTSHRSSSRTRSPRPSGPGRTPGRTPACARPARAPRSGPVRRRARDRVDEHDLGSSSSVCRRYQNASPSRSRPARPAGCASGRGARPGRGPRRGRSARSASSCRRRVRAGVHTCRRHRAAIQQAGRGGRAHLGRERAGLVDTEHLVVVTEREPQPPLGWGSAVLAGRRTSGPSPCSAGQGRSAVAAHSASTTNCPSRQQRRGARLCQGPA